MRHTLLVPLQLLVRASPPTGPHEIGDMYYDTNQTMVMVFNGTKWDGLQGTSGDEVRIAMTQPSEENTELWVDIDESSVHGTAAYLPLAGRQMTGPLVIVPTNPLSTALLIGRGGIDVEQGGVRIKGTQINNSEQATSKGYVDSLFSSIGGTTGARRYTAFIGNGIQRTIRVTHNLGTENIVPSLWWVATKEMFTTQIKIIDTNSIDVSFDADTIDIPKSNSVKIVIISMA